MDSRIYIRIPATTDDLHIPTSNETTRHVKIVVNILLQNDRRKWSELLSTFDRIYLILYIWSSRVGEEASVAQGSRPKFSTTGSNSNDSIVNQTIDKGMDGILTGYVSTQVSVGPINTLTVRKGSSTKTTTSVARARHDPNVFKIFT
jgi:hypothetical protein